MESFRTMGLACIVGLALALAGCSRGPDSSDSAPSEDEQPYGATAGNVTTGPASPSAGVEVNATQQSVERQYDNRTGSISGNQLVVSGPTPAEEAFTSYNGTLLLAANLTVDGGDVTLHLVPPGCEDESCWEEVTVSSGQASVERQQPLEGSWTFRLAADDGVGPFEADYMLETYMDIQV